MSYAVYDANGYVGDMASGGGLKELREHAVTTDNEALKTFVDDGYADPDTLAKAITLPVGESELGDTLKNLKELAGKCELIMIISNGIEDDVDEDEK